MSRVTSTQVAIAFREMAVMFAAGVPLTRALMIEGRGAPGTLGQAFLQASGRVSSGKRLSESLAPYRSMFGALTLELVAVAEKTGALQLIMERVACYHEERNVLERKLKASLTYPAFVFGTSLLIILVLPSLLLGHLFELLNSLGSSPPLLTVWLLRLSKVLGHPLTWVLGAGAAVGGLKLLHRALEVPGARLRLESYLWRVPGLGRTLICAHVSLFALALHTLYTAGMPMLGALRSAGRASGSERLAASGEAMAERVADGQTLHRALAEEGYFPKAFVHLVAAGEEAGGLDRMLARGSELARQEVEYRLAIAMAALEPILLLVMGGLVAVLVLATVSPLLAALESLS